MHTNLSYCIAGILLALAFSSGILNTILTIQLVGECKE